MTIQQAEKIFDSLKKENRLGHSYLFFGENRQEINLFIKKVANNLMAGESSLVSSTIFNLQVIDGVTSGIDQIISAGRFLWERPISAPYKILIIINADQLGREAQNALLKITEEPPEYAICLLSLPHSELIISTLASRFQKVYIQTYGHEKNQIVIDKNLLQRSFQGDASVVPELLEQFDENPLILELWFAMISGKLLENIKRTWPILKKILFHNTALQQYTVNRKLQLEVMIQSLRI